MNPPTIAAVAVIVIGAAVLQSVSGFGFSLMSVPLLAMLLGAKDAVATASLFGLSSSIVQLGLTHRAVRWPIVGRLLTGAVLGMPLGLVVLVTVDERLLRFVIAVTVLVFAAVLAVGFRPRGRGIALDVGAGFVSGVLNTSVSTNGPPLVFALQARDLPPPAFRGTISATFAASNVVGVTLFAVAGRYTPHVLSAGGVGVPALVVGWLLGARLAPRFPPDRFRALVLALLVATSVSALVSLAVG